MTVPNVNHVRVGDDIHLARRHGLLYRRARLRGDDLRVIARPRHAITVYLGRAGPATRERTELNHQL